MSAKLEPGTYDTKVIAATIYEAPSGAVMLRMQLEIGLTGGLCLIQKDGTLSERGFKDAQAIFGLIGPWDWALWEREPEEWAGADVQAVVETVQGERGEFSSVKYVNVPGGGQQALVKADGKALAAKYGAKTRALFGGAPAAPKSTPKKAPPAPKAKPPVKGLESTMDAAWELFCKLHEGEDETALYEQWAVAISEAAGKEQNDCTPEDWGKVVASIDKLKM